MVTISRAVLQIKDWLSENGYKDEYISRSLLKTAIRETRGSDPRTVDKWIDVLKAERRLKGTVDSLTLVGD